MYGYMQFASPLCGQCDVFSSLTRPFSLPLVFKIIKWLKALF